METNHTIPIAIEKYGSNTQAYFSFIQPRNLIIFIHGFGGDATGTWSDFPKYLISEQEFRFSDIIFYGYNTFKGQAGDHAGEFYDFLKLSNYPLYNSILPKEQNLPERDYEKIIIIAHSLGAVIARQALLLCHVSHENWVNKVSLALFAPAHNGANIISLATEALPGLFGLIGVFAKFKYPILKDLDPNDKGILESIKNHTSQLQNEGKANYTRAKLVVFAKGDKVVKSFPYLNDIPPKIIPNVSHTGVCKPKSDYMNPIDLIKSLI